MPISLDPTIPREPILRYLVALADDELVLGHRDSEWTGHAPILEEDIAFSNVAQDELGHALALFTLAGDIDGVSPDVMAFERKPEDFRCCRFVEYPKGDFAYTVVRQFFFDVAEQVRMKSLARSPFGPLARLAEKVLAEEAYHLMHSQGLFERLAKGTEESKRRMQEAVLKAFPQALGMFEEMEQEVELVRSGTILSSESVCREWLQQVVPIVKGTALNIPVSEGRQGFRVTCSSDNGGRRGKHSATFAQLIQDLQQVYQSVPGAKW
jgi:ring-1,2-phenylacetyl-CoA epoxidase subunit PaaC